jgi:hypothetical protein
MECHHLHIWELCIFSISEAFMGWDCGLLPSGFSSYEYF